MPGCPILSYLPKSRWNLSCFIRGIFQLPDSIALAKRCEQAAFDVSPLIKNSEGANVSAQQSHFVSANSLGFMAGFATSRHSVSCSVIAGNGQDMQRDDWYVTQRNAANFPAVEKVGDYAARRALSRLKPRRLKTRKCPVVFEASPRCWFDR